MWCVCAYRTVCAGIHAYWICDNIQNLCVDIYIFMYTVINLQDAASSAHFLNCPPNHHHHLSFITGSLPWFTQVGSCDKSSIHPTHHGTTSTLSAHSLQINPVIKLCNGQIRFNVIPRLTHNLRDFHRLERVPKQTSSVSTTKRISLTLSFS